MSRLYKHSGKALFAKVGEDIVALNIEGGQCYGMDQIAGTVWSLLAEPTDIGKICDHLVTIYEVDPQLCRTDVAKLIQQFESEGLLDRIDPAS